MRKGPPAYAPPPVFSWAGLYGGINIGYGFGSGDSETGAQTLVRPPFGGRVPARAYSTGWSLPTDLNGVVGGGQVGYNIQYSPWLVLGLEADIQAADLRSQGHGVIGLPSGPRRGAISPRSNLIKASTGKARFAAASASRPSIRI